MKKIFLASVAFTTVMLAAAAAQAAVTVTSVDGSSLSPTFQGANFLSPVYITFEDVTVGTGGTFTSNGFSFTGDGNVENTNVAGAFAPPAGDTSHYLTTGFDGNTGTKTEVLTTGTQTNFGLYWGSMDTYNTLEFFKGGVGGKLVASFAGCSSTDLTPGCADSGNQINNTTNRYVNFNFTGGDTYDTVVFVTTTPAFEVDNLAIQSSEISNGVPELSTWGMMLLGFAGIGLVAYRRTKKTALAAA